MTNVYSITWVWEAAGAAEIAVQLEAMEVGRMGRAALDSFQRHRGHKPESLFRPPPPHRRPTSRFAPSGEFLRAMTVALITQRELLPPVPSPAPFRRSGPRNSAGRDRDALRGTLEIRPVTNRHPIGRITLPGIGPYPIIQHFFQTRLALVNPEVRTFIERGYTGIMKKIGEPLVAEEFAQLALERLNSLLITLEQDFQAAAKGLVESELIPPTPYERIYFYEEGVLVKYPYVYGAALFLFQLFREAKARGVNLIQLAFSDSSMRRDLTYRAERNLGKLEKVIEAAPLVYLTEHGFPPHGLQ